MFYVPLVFAKFGEILVKYFVYESVFGFPPFQSTIEAFSTLVKNENLIISLFL